MKHVKEKLYYEFDISSFEKDQAYKIKLPTIGLQRFECIGILYDIDSTGLVFITSQYEERPEITNISGTSINTLKIDINNYIKGDISIIKLGVVENEQWGAVGPISAGVRPRPDKTKPKQDESREEVTMKEEIVKGDRTKEKKPIDIIEYEPQFDIACGDITPNFPYILEIDNINTGISEKHIVVITKILNNCIYCNQWDALNDNPHSGIELTASEFRERNATLYKITGADLK